MGATSSVCHDMSMANRFLMDANVSRCVTPKVNRTAHIDEKALRSRNLFLSDLFSVVLKIAIIVMRIHIPNSIWAP